MSYPDESDKGPFLVPDNIPIEGWPAHYRRNPKLKDVTLDDVQRDKLKEDGDRHAIVVDPTNRMLYEFYQLKKIDGGWQAACEATFDLKSNKLRPDGWTSSRRRRACRSFPRSCATMNSNAASSSTPCA